MNIRYEIQIDVAGFEQLAKLSSTTITMRSKSTILRWCVRIRHVAKSYTRDPLFIQNIFARVEPHDLNNEINGYVNVSR